MKPIVAARRTAIGEAYLARVQQHLRRVARRPRYRRGDRAGRDRPRRGRRRRHGLRRSRAQQQHARQAALRAGLPNTVSGMTIDRQCSAGLMVWRQRPNACSTTGPRSPSAPASRSISLVQNDKVNAHGHRSVAEGACAELGTSMIETAEIVAIFGISAKLRTSTPCNRSNAPPRRRRKAALTARSRP